MSVSVTNRVQEILDRGSGKSPVDLAWEHTAEPHVVRELFAVLRRRDPKIALDALRVRFLEEERYRREDKVFRREMYECVEALGATAHAWLPYFVAHADLAPFALVLGRLGDPRAIPPLLTILPRARGALLAAVIDALGRLRAVSAVESLIAMLQVPFEATSVRGSDRVGHRRVVANACLALGRIGDDRAMPALLELVTDTPHDMESVVARAIVALAWLGDDRATHTLLPLLEGRNRNVSMYALARIADRSSASHVEAAVARLNGTPEQLIYPRLMLEALRSRLGRAVNLDVARFALTVVMASRFEATELHETALRIAAVHADPDEIVAVARRFVDAEHPRVREAATLALASAGVAVEPRWLDRPCVDEVFRREGVRGLVGALAQPDAVFRHNVLRKAAEAEVGAELEAPALTALKNMVAFPRYSEDAVVDRHESTFDALEALARFHTPAADAFLIGLLDHPSVMIRSCAVEIAKVDVYGASERLREALRARPASRGTTRPTMPVARLGGGPWLFGPPVRRLAIDRAGSRCITVGEDKTSLFDADGTVVTTFAMPDAVAAAFERHGERAVVISERGIARVLDARSGVVASDLTINGVAHATCVAFAADGRVLIGTEGGRIVKEHAWTRKLDAPIAAMTVHPDFPHVLVAVGGRAAWIDERDGAERVSSKPGRPVIDVAYGASARMVAVLRSGSLELCESTMLERRGHVRIPSAERVAFARGGRALVVAVGGREPGLVRVDLPDLRATKIAKSETALSCLAVDPVTGLVLAAGAGVRVDLWDLNGTASSLPIAQHTSAVHVLLADVGRGRAFSFGADGLVLQWDTDAREIVAGWRLPRRSVVMGATVGSSGRTIVIGAGDRLLALDLVTGATRFDRAVPRLRSLARGVHSVWAVTGHGLCVFDEAHAVGGERHRGVGALRVLREDLKTGSLFALDDHRFALVQSSRILVLDGHEGHALQRLSLGKGKVAITCGGGEAGVVVAMHDRTLRRWVGSPLDEAASSRVDLAPEVAAVDEVSERLALAQGDRLVVLEPDLVERARVRLEFPVSALAFAERGLLVCGGRGGEIAVVETER